MFDISLPFVMCGFGIQTATNMPGALPQTVAVRRSYAAEPLEEMNDIMPLQII